MHHVSWMMMWLKWSIRRARLNNGVSLKYHKNSLLLISVVKQVAHSKANTSFINMNIYCAVHCHFIFVDVLILENPYVCDLPKVARPLADTVLAIKSDLKCVSLKMHEINCGSTHSCHGLNVESIDSSIFRVKENVNLFCAAVVLD